MLITHVGLLIQPWWLSCNNCRKKSMAESGPGLNPSHDFDIDRTKLEIISGYSNSMVLGGLWWLTISNQVSAINTPNVLSIAIIPILYYG